MLGVGPTSIKRWSDEGLLPAIKTAGGHRRYRISDVEALLRRADQPEEPLHQRLARMSRQMIDELEEGIIRLDDNGVVTLYNRAESAFTGFDREKVEGKHFFTDVAPCTNNPIIMGRFLEGVKADQLDVHVLYTFTVKMRPTNVELHMYRDRDSGTNWMIIRPQM